MSHRREYETQRDTLEERVADGEVDERTADAIAELCDAFDPGVEAVPVPEGERHRAVKTLDMYTRRLRLIAERFEGDLTETTASDLNQEMQRWFDGSHPAVDDRGLARNTISNYQGPLRVFYRYHDYGIDPEEIEITTPERSAIAPRDMLTNQDLERIREVISSTRVRMIFEFLLNTGVRNRAARTVKLSDIDLTSGVFHLDDNVEGLKGAAVRGTKRPLLGAEPAVRRWLTEHPAPGTPDAHLITNCPDSPHLDPVTPVSHTHLGKVLRELKMDAGIDKPLHPHALRHNFVTRAKRDYEMDDTTIKYLIGHPPDSDVMERTYQHISADMHVVDAQSTAGAIDDPARRGLTPKRCTGCGARLGPDTDSCDACGAIYSPSVGFDAMETAHPEDVARSLLADEQLKRRLVTAVAERVADNSEF